PLTPFPRFPSQNRAGGRIITVQPAEEFAVDGVVDASPKAQGARVWLEVMFEEHYRRIVSMLVRLTGDRCHAEEVASDVFCKLSRQPGLIVRDSSRTAWIYRVAMNAGLDALRSDARRRRREEAAGAESAHAHTSGDALESMVRRERRAQ